mgnify:CR=1 FL=1
MTTAPNDTVNTMNINTSDSIEKTNEDEKTQNFTSASNSDGKTKDHELEAKISDTSTRVNQTDQSMTEQSITINDPLQVTITLVQSTSEHKRQEQTSSSDSTEKKTTREVSDLNKLTESEGLPSEQSITINDPVQVTIKVIQDSGKDKTSETGLPTLSSSTTAETISSSVDGLKTPDSFVKERSSEVDDPTSISSSKDAKKDVEALIPSSTKISKKEV